MLLLKVVMVLLLLLVMVVLLLVLLIGPGKRLDGWYGWWDRLIGRRLEPLCDALGDRVSQVDRMFVANTTTG